MEASQALLLEPMMQVEVETPEEYQGDIMGDLNRRRGQIQNRNAVSIRYFASVPLSKCSAIRYGAILSKGRGL